jgi:hypothetical protein
MIYQPKTAYINTREHLLRVCNTSNVDVLVLKFIENVINLIIDFKIWINALYLDVRYLNTFDMKRLLLVIVSALFLGACAQKTCPTYSFNDLNTEQECNTEEQSV